jgi:hypothetical protein
MKIYLNNTLKLLQNYSRTLDKTSILINKPWTLIDENFELQKFIFKKNNELLLSKNGQVNIGKWEYYAEAKSLLIDRGFDKILCNEEFIDDGVLILKIDGNQDKYFILANENLIPDLNVTKYLKEFRNKKLNIFEIESSDGKTLEIQKIDFQTENERIGNLVTHNSEIILDGNYLVDNKKRLIEIKNSRIFKIYHEAKYKNPDGKIISIYHKDTFTWSISNGDILYINEKNIESGIINFSKTKNLVIQNGKIVRLESKNVFTKSISKFISKILGI